MSLICEERSVINEEQKEKRKIEMLMLMVVKKMRIMIF
jgi:hypothetical protein